MTLIWQSREHFLQNLLKIIRNEFWARVLAEPSPLSLPQAQSSRVPLVGLGPALGLYVPVSPRWDEAEVMKQVEGSYKDQSRTTYQVINELMMIVALPLVPFH